MPSFLSYEMKINAGVTAYFSKRYVECCAVKIIKRDFPHLWEHKVFSPSFLKLSPERQLPIYKTQG